MRKKSSLGTGPRDPFVLSEKSFKVSRYVDLQAVVNGSGSLVKGVEGIRVAGDKEV